MTPSPLDRALRQTLLRLGNSDALTDAQLLERFAVAHDEAAFAELMRRHGPMVHGICRRLLGPVPDADDAFQAVFIVLFRRASSPARPKSLGGWLHGVAYRVARIARNRSIQRLAREKSMEVAAPAGLAQPGSAEAAGADVKPVLDEELARLPERYRAPLVLCYLEGRSVDQAAAELGVARGTVASRMSRGRDLLRSRLTRRGLAMSAAALTAQLESTASAAVPVAMLQGLVPAGFVSGTGIREGAALLSKEALQAMFWTKLRWAGILLTCVLALGTASVKWATATRKAAASKNGSASLHSEFYVRWRFDNGPPKDIRMIEGQWTHRPGKPGVMVAPQVLLMLPTALPDQPLVCSVKVQGPPPDPIGTSECSVEPRNEKGQGTGHVGWFNEKELRSYYSGERFFKFYLIDRWIVVNSGKHIRAVGLWAKSYRSERLALMLKNCTIEEIEIRALRQAEIPPDVQNIAQTVQAMSTGPQIIDEQGGYFDVHWRCDNGPPKGLRVIGGQWTYRPGKPGLMDADRTWLVLPQVPNRPFEVSLKVHKGPLATACQYRVRWLKDGTFCPGRFWSSPQTGESGRWLKIYFTDRWSVALDQGKATWIADYQAPYPGQHVAIWLGNLALEEIRMRRLRPKEQPPNVETLIKSMGAKREDFQDRTIPR